MPVNTRHPEYVTMLPKWQRIRHFAGGDRDAIKAKAVAESYLPRPDGLDQVDYDKGYLVRAPLFAVAAQAAQALSGTLTRKPPTVSDGRFKTEFASNIDLAGTTLESFIAKCTDEMFQPARFGIMIDRPSPLQVVDTKGEVIGEAPPERAHDRPYWALYETESIINWKTEVDENGVEFLRFIVLEENAPVEKSDPFLHATEPRWRVLRLNEQGQYVVDLWRLKAGVLLSAAQESDFVRYATRQPSRMGQPLTRIPFEIFGPRDRKWPCDIPPILKVVDANWDHYMRGADYVHSLHFTACPMPWASAEGLSPDAKDHEGNPLVVKWGSSRVLTLPPQGKVEVAEVTGAGAEANLKALQMFEAHIAHLSSQMLSPEKRAAEAAETLEIRTAGQTATLASIARTMTAGFSELAKITMEWAGAAATETTITINTDFVAGALSSQELDALTNAHELAKITDEDLFWNLERGERVKPDQGFEAWNQARLEQAMSRAPAVDADGELGVDDEARSAA